jgi:hypothetical protein
MWRLDSPFWWISSGVLHQTESIWDLRQITHHAIDYTPQSHVPVRLFSFLFLAKLEQKHMCDWPTNSSVAWRDLGFVFDGLMKGLEPGRRYFYKVL